MPAFVEEKFLTYPEALEMILELGGVPCYPTLADGASPICPYEDPVEDLILRLKENNIHCCEFIPIRNRPEILSKYVRSMREAGLVVMGGTEHNTLDLLPIEPACLEGLPVPEDIRQIFWEGACVIAAHQFLTAHGECGFVDGRGTPNQNFSSVEKRIQAFSQIGAKVIRRYFDNHIEA